MTLLDPLELGSRRARNRMVFGPHETNLARRRAISDRHVAYYRRRATGGAGVIVIEEASVHASDWPYERCPLASDSVDGWKAVADACRGEGALVLAALGHSGGQGSSAYNQLPLWAPSRVPEVNSREVPKSMEPEDIADVVEGFAWAASAAIASGLDGIEINVGQHSLVRQFASRLTNQRDDEWGHEPLRFGRDVMAAVRAAAGRDAIVGMRLSCDELAPWAGIVPEAAAEIAIALVAAGDLDYVTVVRGSIFTVSATRPDGHVAPGFNLALAGSIRAALAPPVVVIAQGSIVDADQADAAITDGLCDAVEMTRAQLADPELGLKLSRGHRARVRPCILCNQACMVRDARNPIVSCVVEPSSGHEWEDESIEAAPPNGRGVFVVGGGVAGLETARVAAIRGHRVTVAERSDVLGGAVRVAALGAGRERFVMIADWLEQECAQLGVIFARGREIGIEQLTEVDGEVVLCTGSLPGRATYEIEADAVVRTAAAVLAGEPLPDGAIAVWDPIGGPIGISVAEWLRNGGRDVHLVTPDLIAGNELSRSGDLAPANVRLLSAGVTIEKRSLLRAVAAGRVQLEDRFTGEPRTLEVAAVVDGGYRLPNDRVWRAGHERAPRAGDAVAPRTIHEAILEGRRCALELDLGRAAGVAVAPVSAS
ncbi:MAG TPA: mycofactocin system FadH/OYE family oxidoreductase 1 [Acidimicrobiales bacterium]